MVADQRTTVGPSVCPFGEARQYRRSQLLSRVEHHGWKEPIFSRLWFYSEGFKKAKVGSVFLTEETDCTAHSNPNLYTSNMPTESTSCRLCNWVGHGKGWQSIAYVASSGFIVVQIRSVSLKVLDGTWTYVIPLGRRVSWPLDHKGIDSNKW